MGYGSRALQLLQEYYEFKWTQLGDFDREQVRDSMCPVTPARPSCANADANADTPDANADTPTLRTDLPPLLLQLQEHAPPRPALTYLAVAFGLTVELFRFWKRNAFLPLYLRQTQAHFSSIFSFLACFFVSDFTYSSISILL